MQNSSIFSLTLAKKFSADNTELAFTLFDMLVADIDNVAQKIKQHAQKNELENLYQVVHKLHGSSLCCGTVELEKNCAELVKKLKEKKSIKATQDIKPLLQAIKNVMGFDIEQIKQKNS